MSISRRLARPLLSAMFVYGGVDTLRNPEPRVRTAEDTATTIGSTVPGLPADAGQLVKINAAVQVGGGLLLAIGKFRRLAALALLGSILPTTYAGHQFWTKEGPDRAQQLNHFLKNVGLAGGLILAAVDTEGRPSLGWRARRGAKRAGAAVSAGRQRAEAQADRGGDLLGKAVDALPVG
jgi:uncharacterized membrane protein YphA (DoxX/SURF4 family)